MRPIRKISVLMSVYFKEDPSSLDLALESVWDYQKLKPAEIVLVKDGPLTAGLDEVLSQWHLKLEGILKILPLEKNVGLGRALGIGLKECSNELIARMDTDDIAKPGRFEVQLQAFESQDVDICGGWIKEYPDYNNDLTNYEKKALPKSHSLLIRYAKFRNPMNHVTVMFKKSAVLNVGGYKKMLWFEDYYLWVRMMLNGATFYNVQEVLVDVRAGSEQLLRRRGIKYALREVDFLLEVYKLGFLGKLELVRNLLLRIPVRMLPGKFIALVYEISRKKRRRSS